MKLLMIAAGGGIGALLRYLISGIAYRLFGSTFPWGTLSVNLIGAFFIGFLWAIFEKTLVPANVRGFILVGVLGALTTFSTYSLESFNLLRDGEVRLALVNILVNNFFSIALVFAGIGLAGVLISSFK